MRSRKTVYLDNAATSYPKPPSVVAAVKDALQKPFGNPGRGSHLAARAAQDTVFTLRERAGEFFGAEPENVVLTSNSTHGLNLAVKCAAGPESHFLISDLEHNSVRRPVLAVRERLGCTVETFGTFGGDPDLIAADIKKKIRPGRTVVASIHVSNICNVELPVKTIGELCRQHDCIYIVDASQSAGHRPIDVESSHADVLCMPGHKGLFGPMGTGLMIVGPDFADKAKGEKTLLEGGSDFDSLSETMPDLLPERFEAGTLNAHGAAGLLAGLEFVMKTGLENIAKRENELFRQFAEMIGGVEGVTLYTDGTPGAVALFNIDGVSPATAGARLNDRGVCVRSGFHCAPLAHRTLGTGKDGAVRVSFGWFNTPSDAVYAADSIAAIARG